MAYRRNVPATEQEVDGDAPERDITREVVTALEELCEMYEAVGQDFEAQKSEGLPEELKKRLAAAAKKQGVKKEALAKTLLEKGLNELEKKKLLSTDDEETEDEEKDTEDVLTI
jgi:predicted DNA-binding protein